MQIENEHKDQSGAETLRNLQLMKALLVLPSERTNLQIKWDQPNSFRISNSSVNLVKAEFDDVRTSYMGEVQHETMDAIEIRFSEWSALIEELQPGKMSEVSISSVSHVDYDNYTEDGYGLLRQESSDDSHNVRLLIQVSLSSDAASLDVKYYTADLDDSNVWTEYFSASCKLIG